MFNPDAFRRKLLVQERFCLQRFRHAQGAVVELFRGHLTQSFFKLRLDFRDNTVIFIKPSRSDGRNYFIRFDDAVENADVHIHEKAVRSLDVGRFLPARVQRSCLVVIGQLEYPQVSGEFVHDLDSEGHKQVKTCLIYPFLNAGP